jgi:hypothetical protein
MKNKKFEMSNPMKEHLDNLLEKIMTERREKSGFTDSEIKFLQTIYTFNGLNYDTNIYQLKYIEMINRYNDYYEGI